MRKFLSALFALSFSLSPAFAWQSMAPLGPQNSQGIETFANGVTPLPLGPGWQNTGLVAYMDFTTGLFPSWLSYASASQHYVYDSTGTLRTAPNNLLLNSSSLSTQTISTLTANATYILSATMASGSSITLSGGASGTLNGSGGGTRVYLSLTPTTSTVTFTLTGSASQAQLEQVTAAQTTPRAWNPTTGAAYYGPPFDYDPTTLANAGLRVEGSTTNVVTYNQQIGGTNWIFSNASQGAAITATDGSSNGYLIQDTATTTQHAVFQNVSGLTASVTYTWSVYLKAGVYNNPLLLVGDGSFANGYQVHVTLSGAGTVSGGGSGGTGTYVGAAIQQLPNGWYRVSLTGIIGGGATSGYVAIYLNNGSTYLGVVGQGSYMWGAQFEQQYWMTSPVLTYTTSAARSTDLIQVIGSVAATMQASSGSVLTETSMSKPGVAGLWQEVFGAGSGHVKYRPANASSDFYNGTTDLFSNAGVDRSVNTNRDLVGWSPSGRSIVITGATVATDANLANFNSTPYLGCWYSATNCLFGWFTKFAIYNYRLSDTALAAKSVIGVAP